MQRTVKSTKVTYAKVEVVNGELTTRLDNIKIHGVTDEKTAIRKAKKLLGEIVIVKTALVEDLWVLEDETFFKYAHIENHNEE